MANGQSKVFPLNMETLLISAISLDAAEWVPYFTFQDCAHETIRAGSSALVLVLVGAPLQMLLLSLL